MDFKKEAQRRIRECQEKQLPELDLKDLELREVPLEVWEMNWLEVLKLGEQNSRGLEQKN